MIQLKITKKDYEAISQGLTPFFIGKDMDIPVGATIQFLIVDNFYGSGLLSKESYFVTSRVEASDRRGLVPGGFVLGLKPIIIPRYFGDRSVLSPRARNVLVREKISDEHLVRMEYKDLIVLRQCGKKTALELMRYRSNLIGGESFLK